MSTAMLTAPPLECALCAARLRRAEIAALRRRGFTFREIGEKMGGISRQTVHRAWRKLPKPTQ